MLRINIFIIDLSP